jgi:acid stress-induced BolA-like protein IbaG/YrbA
MIEKEVEERIARALRDATVSARGDDHRMDIRVVSPDFEGLTRVKQQQLVYAAISDLIGAGRLHAVSIQALTPAQARG